MTTFNKNIVWMRMRFLSLLWTVILLSHCSTDQRESMVREPQPDRIELETWEPYNWQQKAQYLETMRSFKKLNEADYTILVDSLGASNQRLIQGALSVIITLKINDFKNQCISSLDNKDQLVRWYAVRCLESLSPGKKILPALAESMFDSEWLVREVAIRAVRLYPEEKEKKDYFKTVLYTLKNTEPNSLEETYKTIFWYEDARSLRFLLKRSFLAKSEVELLFIIQQLARSSDRQVTIRLSQLKEKSQYGTVRKIATDLLKNR
jgi:hypothetical protein